MPKAEIVGSQLRIRVRNPKLFTKFRVHDVGRKGHTQRVASWSRKTGWLTQSWRVNVNDLVLNKKGDIVKGKTSAITKILKRYNIIGMNEAELYKKGEQNESLLNISR